MHDASLNAKLHVCHWAWHWGRAIAAKADCPTPISQLHYDAFRPILAPIKRYILSRCLSLIYDTSVMETSNWFHFGVQFVVARNLIW